MRGAAKHLVRTLVLILILSVGWFAGLYFGRQLTDNQLRIYLNNYNAQNDKLSRVLMMIENEYIDSISRDSLTELAIPAILKKLDPHSVYLPPKEFEQADEPLQGEFDGIGVVFNMATDTVIVLNVIPSGPSRKAGVLGGDRIIKVNDTLIAGQKWSQTAVMKRLRGPRGTQVKLSIERKGIDGLVDIVVTRDAIPLHSVEASMMMTDKIGFIKLSQFSRTSYAEIKKALLSLRAQGMKSLILDLRGNSGGFLDQAILIANEFLPAGALIVYTEDRNGKQMRQYSDGRGGSTDLKMAVLIDEASASSSDAKSSAPGHSAPRRESTMFLLLGRVLLLYR